MIPRSRHSGKSRNPGEAWVAPIFMPWCASGSRHGRLVRKHVPDSDPGCALQSTSMPALHRRNVPICRPMVDGGIRKCSAGACPPLGSGWGVAESAAPIRCTKPQLRLFIPWCAGTSRHGRLVRKWVAPVTPAGIQNPHVREHLASTSMLTSLKAPGISAQRRTYFGRIGSTRS